MPKTGAASVTGTVLLLDEGIVAEARGCRQVFHTAVKDPANPIITRTEPWEGKGPYTWGNRLLRNPETLQYNLWYTAWEPDGNLYRWGLAVSDDGLTWTKPELRIEVCQGAPARNMLAAAVAPSPDRALLHRVSARSVVRDPRADCAPAERYKGIRFTYEGEYVSFSPDGVHWTECPDNPVWFVPSDIIHAMWDPERDRFVAYYKLWDLTGETPDPASPSGYRPVRAYFPTFDRHPSSDGLAEFRGPAVTFHPDGIASVDAATYVLRSGDQGPDDGGGGSLTGAWRSRRVIAWAESDDFRHWRHERVVLACDEGDPPDANIQYMQVIHYGGYYIGFLTMHDERGYFEQQLAFSRDGLRWSRPWRGNVIGLGPAGAFDSGMVLAPVDPIVTETQMVFYYGGFDVLHHQDMWQHPWSAAIGRAVLRRDGFASWENLPGETGVLLTQPLRTDGSTLWINADASGGRCTVEVLSEDGRPMPGRAAADCVALSEDTRRFKQCRAPVQWVSSAGLGVTRGQPFRLRFNMENARLFAFGIDPWKEQET